MMIKPGITELAKKADSRYTLVTMAAKRARMVGREQNTAEVYDPKADKPVSVAVQEIAKGRVGFVRTADTRKVNNFEEENEMINMTTEQFIDNSENIQSDESVSEEI